MHCWLTFKHPSGFVAIAYLELTEPHCSLRRGCTSLRPARPILLQEVRDHATRQVASVAGASPRFRSGLMVNSSSDTASKSTS